MEYDDVLALSPHTDDAELGAGGLLSKLVDQGSDVTVFAFSAPGASLKEEFRNALSILGIHRHEIFSFNHREFPAIRQDILEILYEYDQDHRPDLVLTPSTNDLHQDHRVVTNEVMRAFKASTILGYELPWNNIHFDQNCFVELDQGAVDTKIRCLRQYGSQVELRDYFQEDYLRGLVKTRGLQIGTQYAESFEVIRMVIA